MKPRNFPGRKRRRIVRLHGQWSKGQHPEVDDMRFKIGRRNRDQHGRAVS